MVNLQKGETTGELSCPMNTKRMCSVPILKMMKEGHQQGKQILRPSSAGHGGHVPYLGKAATQRIPSE
jgi:hypothetical protein